MNMNMEGSRNNIDRISALPNNLIHRILSFTGTKFAVRTGLLSKRWRSLWTSVPVLDFDHQEFCEPFDFEKLIEQLVLHGGRVPFFHQRAERMGLDEFVLFVNATLKRCAKTDLQRFRLSAEGYVDPLQVIVWINYAISRHTADLELELPTHEHMLSCAIFKGCSELPSSIFKCKSLTSLKLRMTQCWFFNTPATVKLHGLVTLHLDAIVWRDDSLENVISKCPNLETLRSLEQKISLKCSSKLVNARVDIIGDDVGPCYTSLVLYKERHLFKLLPTFPNLKHLKFRGFFPDFSIEALACLLKHSPALETLKITDFGPKLPALLRIVDDTAGWRSRILSSACLLHLKEVKMKGFDSSPGKLDFLKFLLMNSVSLQKNKNNTQMGRTVVVKGGGGPEEGRGHESHVSII
ncbi:putative F-box/FBD/LRR-repeat protein [Acorus gramineus]|uniref:F-box/FBD/LRR-repeat protein n=1 Tax=Acorus gramineus TaxID=55184 RepID=A0AAV9BSW8_ACOGR|nr:putative F-box/FBD/LRR-repeat protein [Acorus gramineus]